ncbi:MAG: glycosyltransferase family 39 protein [Candidatus Methanosuratus sp.]|nr:glycosyltransferase family 39 protein [Candidatus Methanosuratincola sp.]
MSLLAHLRLERHIRAYPWVAILTIAAAFGIWRAQQIDLFGWAPDEGNYVMAATWLGRGYPLYTKVGVLAYPVFMESLAAIFRLLGPSLVSARALVVFSGVSYLIVAGVIGRRLSTWTGGFTALAVLLTDNELFLNSGLVLSEVPALLLAALCFFLVLTYLSTSRTWHLCLAGILCGLSLLSKPLFPLLPLWLVLVVLTRQWWGKASERQPFERRRLMLTLSLAFLSLALPFILCLLIYEPDAFFQSTFWVRWNLHQEIVSSGGFQKNWNIIWAYLSQYRAILPLVVLMPLSIPSRSRPDQLKSLSLVMFAGLTLFGLLWHSPLYPRHCVILSLPIALMAGTSADAVVVFIRARTGPAAQLPLIVLTALIAASLLRYSFEISVQRDFRTKFPQGGPERAAIELFQRLTAPQEPMVSDDLTLVSLAGRLVPPELSDISSNRITSGHLSDSRLISLVEDYDVQLISFWLHRLGKAPSFVRWAKSHFVGSIDFEAARRVLYGRRYDSLQDLQDISGLQPIPETRVGDSISLVGYRLEKGNLHPGQETYVVLYWECLKPMEQEYQVFIHLADSNDAPVSQADGPPINGFHPTSEWMPGDLLADVHKLVIPTDVPSGEYRLLAGMYDLRSLERVPVRNGDPAGRTDAIYLTHIPIAQGEQHAGAPLVPYPASR